MVLLQIDLTRFVAVYIGQGVLFIFFLFIAYKIIKRSQKGVNYIFSCFYLFTALGLFINFIYAPIPIVEIQRTLNTLTNYFVFFGLIFLPIFDIQLLLVNKMRHIISLILISTYGILLSLIMFINPQSVIIGPTTDWKPVWSFTFLLQLFILKTVVIVIPSFSLQIQIYRRFQINELKKKWFYFNVGMLGIFIFSYGIMFANYFNNPIFRWIISFYSFSILLWGYLIYYGVGKQIGK